MADTPVDFRILAGAGSPARDFKAGEVIFTQGDAARELFIVQSRDGRQGGADCREAVSIPDQQHAAFCLEYDAHNGAAIAQREYRPVSTK